MFQVEDYHVVFQHQKNINARPFATICKIEVVDEKKEPVALVALGEAFCCDKDQFNRNTGRKIALARALQAFPRNRREPFWKAYYAAHGGKW